MSSEEAVASPPVDLEMLGDLLIFQVVELASEFSSYGQSLLSRYHHFDDTRGILLDSGFRLARWLRQRLRPEQKNTKELLPLPQPAVFPLTIQHMDYITERFSDVKTQLQLMYAAVEDLHTKEDQIDSKLSRLHEQLRRIPTCRCEKFTPSSHLSKLTCNMKTTRENRLVGLRNETPTPVLQVDRLEVPL
ncbi:hypothetical protein GN958_ATG02120 [Phytophthora infestans]|uniref:Uncharacterized protein n=1 Tax=Phytophthora infestans TaxID=4787 RepID=A0A8S9V6N1_PHYIN|nr:hypothetical protein GN958_ATG02120 [Phytophthora infestans]